MKDVYKLGILFAAILAITACPQEKEPPVSVTGISLEDTMLTIYGFKQLNPVEPANATNKRVIWESSDPDVVSVSSNGIITALKFAESDTEAYIEAYKSKVTITGTTVDGGFTDTCTVTVTMDAQEHINDLKPLKDSFKDFFMMGNIFDPGDVTTEEPYTINKPWLTYHYNTLTPQNQMKPQYLCGTPPRDAPPDDPTGAVPGVYDEANIATAKRMIAAARAQGIKVQGHCLLWHSQLPPWQNKLRTSSDTKEEVLRLLKEYVTDIVTEFKGTLYAWDVLNEAFNDGGGSWRNAMRNSTTEGNPWYMKLGADFVYEGFLAARLADPDAILYYNDYSLDLVAKATAVRDMVRDVNEQYLASSDKPAGEAAGRLLIEGIGMQSHHNSTVTAAAIKKTLELFKPLGVLISISELDLLAQTWNDYDTSTVSTVTTEGLLKQADMYGQYFKVFLEYSDIIERVTFWGVSDANSWRSRGKPLPFTGERDGWTLLPESIKAKPAYYKMIEAIDNY